MSTSSRTSSHVHAYAALILASFAGVLTRWFLGKLIARENGLGDAVGTSFFANVVGCFVMGVAVECRSLLMKLHPYVFVGLASGFCGSMTTFSTFSQQAAESLVSGHPLRWIVQLMATMCTALLAHGTGRHGAEWWIGRSLSEKHLDHWSDDELRPDRRVDYDLQEMDKERWRPVSPFPFTLPPTRRRDSTISRRTSTASAWELLLLGGVDVGPEDTPADTMHRYVVGTAGLGTLVFLTFLILDIGSRTLWLACLLSPMGTLLRYQWSRHNLLPPALPIFTILANLVATTLLALLHVVEMEAKPTGWGKTVVDAVGIGVCGSLSTVSTFVSEIHVLGDGRRPEAYHYAVLTLGLAQCVGIMINGLHRLVR